MANETKDRTDYTQNKKWVIARNVDESGGKVFRGSEEVKFVEQNGDDLVESMGERNESIADYTNVPVSIVKNAVTFRPFTPPFAQLQSSPRKLVKGLKNDKESEAGLTPHKQSVEDEKDGLEFKEMNEVFGDDSGKIDVVYDPILKCYYDPKTNAYYQLEME